MSQYGNWRPVTWWAGLGGSANSWTAHKGIRYWQQEGKTYDEAVALAELAQWGYSNFTSPGATWNTYWSQRNAEVGFSTGPIVLDQQGDYFGTAKTKWNEWARTLELVRTAEKFGKFKYGTHPTLNPTGVQVTQTPPYANPYGVAACGTDGYLCARAADELKLSQARVECKMWNGVRMCIGATCEYTEEYLRSEHGPDYFSHEWVETVMADLISRCCVILNNQNIGYTYTEQVDGGAGVGWYTKRSDRKGEIDWSESSTNVGPGFKVRVYAKKSYPSCSPYSDTCSGSVQVTVTVCRLVWMGYIDSTHTGYPTFIVPRKDATLEAISPAGYDASIAFRHGPRTATSVAFPFATGGLTMYLLSKDDIWPIDYATYHNAAIWDASNTESCRHVILPEGRISPPSIYSYECNDSGSLRVAMDVAVDFAGLTTERQGISFVLKDESERVWAMAGGDALDPARFGVTSPTRLPQYVIDWDRNTGYAWTYAVQQTGSGPIFNASTTLSILGAYRYWTPALYGITGWH